MVLDEAYVEFANEPSRIKWVQDYDNLVVLRTFSKSAALAGIRVGFGGFPLGMIDFLWRAKQPYNVSAASEIAACAALSNMAYLLVSSAQATPHQKYVDFCLVQRSYSMAELLLLHCASWITARAVKPCAGRNIQR